MEYIITRKSDGMFWAGKGKFSSEYPDAIIMKNLMKAKDEASHLSFMFSNVYRVRFEVISNYGMENEKVEFTV